MRSYIEQIKYVIEVTRARIRDANHRIEQAEMSLAAYKARNAADENILEELNRQLAAAKKASVEP